MSYFLLHMHVPILLDNGNLEWICIYVQTYRFKCSQNIINCVLDIKQETVLIFFNFPLLSFSTSYSGNIYVN